MRENGSQQTGNVSPSAAPPLIPTWTVKIREKGMEQVKEPQGKKACAQCSKEKNLIEFYRTKKRG
ncbi:hypothetical protein KSC_032450 [Ktedonobacter sp. SOSP1-52]|nr:hypothetical protein KSC_032450 [Ktedonobacter sp. SOSP1-52]